MTWYWALPTSSSQALIGGYAGAAIARGGFSVIIPAGWNKTLIFIIVSPLLGFLLGLGLMVAISWILRRATPRQVDRWFRWLQLVSSAGVSLAHGGNDAQKTMGIVPARALFPGYVTPNRGNPSPGPLPFSTIVLSPLAIPPPPHPPPFPLLH